MIKSENSAFWSSSFLMLFGLASDGGFRNDNHLVIFGFSFLPSFARNIHLLIGTKKIIILEKNSRELNSCEKLLRDAEMWFEFRKRKTQTGAGDFLWMNFGISEGKELIDCRCLGKIWREITEASREQLWAWLRLFRRKDLKINWKSFETSRGLGCKRLWTLSNVIADIKVFDIVSGRRSGMGINFMACSLKSGEVYELMSTGTSAVWEFIVRGSNRLEFLRF